MGLRKKLGILLLILGIVFLFSGINSETSLMTGHIFKEYIQGENTLVHSFGLIFLILGLFLLVERKGLDYLIIPTGDNLDEMKRAKRAAQEKANHYIISGIIDKSLKDSETKKIYDVLRNSKGFRENREEPGIKPSQMIIESESTDTLENVVDSIKKMENPKSIGIVSYPEHLRRYKMIIKKAKEEGKISENVQMKYIPVKQSFKETIYGALASVKEKIRLRKGIDSALKHKRKKVGDTLRKNLENKR